MKTRPYTVYILACIVLLSAGLRFFMLGDFPRGLHRDEAFLGYNAYSILKTGRDMTGNVLPFHLKAFLFSPAGYSYASIPWIAFFGLSEFSVRFASALAGVLSVLMTYILARLLFDGSARSEEISLSASLLLAISPWNITLSRTATENSVCVFLISLGTVCFLKYRKKARFRFLVCSAAMYFLSLYCYQAPRAFLPLFIPFLLYFSRSSLTRSRLVKSAFIFILIVYVPVLSVMTSKELSLRLSTVSLFASPQTELVTSEARNEDALQNVNPLIAKLIHTKIREYGETFLDTYAAHFSYAFLFTDRGLPDRYRIPGYGLLHLFELPLLGLGLLTLIKKRNSSALTVLVWVALAPVGSSLAFDDVPNLQRSLLVFPALSIVEAVGFSEILKKAHTTPSRFLLMSLSAGIAGLSLFVYLHHLSVHQLRHHPYYRHQGYRELVSFVNSHKSSYQKAVITNRESAPAIFFLFYSKYDPRTYQYETQYYSGLDYDRLAFASYEFSQEECPVRTVPDPQTGVPTFLGNPDVLYALYGTCEVPPEARKLTTITRSDDTHVFHVVDVAVPDL